MQFAIGLAVRSIHWPGGTGLPCRSAPALPQLCGFQLSRQWPGFIALAAGLYAIDRREKSTSEPSQPSSLRWSSALLGREDCTLLAWYRLLYAPRTGGAYDSHHRTAGIAGRTRRGGSRVAARSARAAAGDAGAAGLVGPRLTALGRVSARLKRDWLRRGPDLLPAHLVCCIKPHDRFIDELDLPLADCGGHYAYYGITGNSRRLSWYAYQV